MDDKKNWKFMVTCLVGLYGGGAVIIIALVLSVIILAIGKF